MTTVKDLDSVVLEREGCNRILAMKQSHSGTLVLISVCERAERVPGKGADSPAGMDLYLYKGFHFHSQGRSALLFTPVGTFTSLRCRRGLHPVGSLSQIQFVSLDRALRPSVQFMKQKPLLAKSV